MSPLKSEDNTYQIHSLTCGGNHAHDCRRMCCCAQLAAHRRLHARPHVYSSLHLALQLAPSGVVFICRKHSRQRRYSFHAAHDKPHIPPDAFDHMDIRGLILFHAARTTGSARLLLRRLIHGSCHACTHRPALFYLCRSRSHPINLSVVFSPDTCCALPLQHHFLSSCIHSRHDADEDIWYAHAACLHNGHSHSFVDTAWLRASNRRHAPHAGI